MSTSMNNVVHDAPKFSSALMLRQQECSKSLLIIKDNQSTCESNLEACTFEVTYKFEESKAE